MKKYIYMLIPFLIAGCTKGKQDTTYSFTCTSTYQHGFTTLTKDTTFNNITTNDANYYARITSVNGWVTMCERQ